MNSLTVENFRCFRGRQTAVLAPLTLLVGENSTGKTSFLALVRTLRDMALDRNQPDFKKPPYDLGSFDEIAHYRGGKGGRAREFTAGFCRLYKGRPANFEVTFRKEGVGAVPRRVRVDGGEVWCEFRFLDVNAVPEVFGPNPTAAGMAFLKWLRSGRGRLVSGGRHAREMTKSGQGWRSYAQVALRRGVLRLEDAAQVDAREDAFAESNLLRSDDPHVIALADLSGARLLYSDDGELKKDFLDKKLVNRPRGKVYPSGDPGSIASKHRWLLKQRNLCPST